MKKILCALIFVGSVAAGYAMATRQTPCEQLHEYCANPSVSNINGAMQCGLVGIMFLSGSVTDAKCQVILNEIKKGPDTF